MTAKELIEKLKVAKPDSQVFVLRELPREHEFALRVYEPTNVNVTTGGGSGVEVVTMVVEDHEPPKESS